MTATALPLPPSDSVADVSRRLGRLLDDGGTVATWWVELAGELDALADRLMTEGQTVWHALRHQLTADAPHLTSHLHRIDSEQEQLQHEVRQVRILTGSAAGDPDSSHRVRTAVRDLLRRLRRYEERTTQILYDAYERDIGGESA